MVTAEVLQGIKNLHDKTHDLTDKQHIRILSINGGGVKGIIPALILQEIEKVAGVPIQKLFDYVVGTSVGGILGLSIAAPNMQTGGYKYNAAMLPGEFSKAVKFAFPQTSWYSDFLSLFRSKYSRDGIDKYLNENFGEAKFSDALLPVSVFSYCENTHGPVFWSSLDGKNEYFLKDAAGATSAAPSYFPPKKIIDPECTNSCENSNLTSKIYNLFDNSATCIKKCSAFYIDGGVCINNPVMMGYAILSGKIPQGLNEDDITVISIGTGQVRESNNYKENGGGKLQNINIYNKMMGGAQLAADLAARLYFDKYIVLNPYIKEENQELDNSSDENMKALAKVATDFIKIPQIAQAIKLIVKCLKEAPKGQQACIEAQRLLDDADENYIYAPDEVLDNLYTTRINKKNLEGEIAKPSSVIEEL